MQIFEFELVDQPVVTAPSAAITPSPAAARAVGREPMEQDQLAFVRPLSLAVPRFVRVSDAASPATLY